METEIRMEEKEFIYLVQLVFIGNYVINGIRKEEEQVKEYNDRCIVKNTNCIISCPAKRRRLTNLPIYGMKRTIGFIVLMLDEVNVSLFLLSSAKEYRVYLTAK